MAISTRSWNTPWLLKLIGVLDRVPDTNSRPTYTSSGDGLEIDTICDINSSTDNADFSIKQTNGPDLVDFHGEIECSLGDTTRSSMAASSQDRDRNRGRDGDGVPDACGRCPNTPSQDVL